MNEQAFAQFYQAERMVREAGFRGGDLIRQDLLAARTAQHRHLDFLAGSNRPDVQCQDIQISARDRRIGLRIWQPARTRSDATLVYLRGGGWWAGTPASSAYPASLLAEEAEMPVCVVDYRLAPEHRFPAQIDDVMAALNWLLHEGHSQGLGSERILLWGESAGATLAVLAARRARVSDRSRIAGLLLAYGNFSGPSTRSTSRSLKVWQQYLPEVSAAVLDKAVVLRAGVDGLPPCWIAVGDADPLLRDSLEFASALSLAAVPHELRIYPGLPHSFVQWSRVLTPARDAIREAASAARRLLAAFVSPLVPKIDSNIEPTRRVLEIER